MAALHRRSSWPALVSRCRASSARRRRPRPCASSSPSRRGVNLLAAARVFLFGARDVWFVVGLPVFLYASGWTFIEVGGFLALWTIGYGVVQAAAPALVTRSADGLSREVPAARLWAVLLAAGAAVAGWSCRAGGGGAARLVVAAGLAVFGFAFAVNSSLHSYLILAYAGSEKAAEDVGFYYAANAAGRLDGILLSGAAVSGWGGHRGLPHGIRRHARHMLGDDPRFADAAGCRWRGVAPASRVSAAD